MLEAATAYIMDDDICTGHVVVKLNQVMRLGGRPTVSFKSDLGTCMLPNRRKHVTSTESNRFGTAHGDIRDPKVKSDLVIWYVEYVV